MSGEQLLTVAFHLVALLSGSLLALVITFFSES